MKCDNCGVKLGYTRYAIGQVNVCEHCFLTRALSSISAEKITRESDEQRNKMLLADAVIWATSNGYLQFDLRQIICDYERKNNG